MGFGLAAVAQELEAQALAQEWGGVVLTFDEAREQTGGMKMGDAHEHK